MTNSNEPQTGAMTGSGGTLDQIRETEQLRLTAERAIQIRLLWLGIIVGAAAGMLVGYLATLITIVDTGSVDFGFKFYRPNFVEGFLRVITAYIIGGGSVGGLVMYVLFTSRQEAGNPFRWLIATTAYALATPLLIGFLLPLTLLFFVDIVEGLRPGLWLSAFVETLLGSFLDGYIFMVKSLYAGVLGGVLFAAVSIGVYIFSQRADSIDIGDGDTRTPFGLYAAAVIVALIPLAILAFGPFSLATQVTSMLTGENL